MSIHPTQPTTEHVTVRLMLEEFQYGRARLTEIHADQAIPSGHVSVRFYRSALIDSVVSKFLLYGNGWIEKALAGFGVDAEIAAVRAALAQPLGKSTLGEVLKDSRNKLISHGVELDIAEHIRRHENATGLSNEELARLVPEAIEVLFDRVEELAHGMDRVAAVALAGRQPGSPNP